MEGTGRVSLYVQTMQLHHGGAMGHWDSTQVTEAAISQVGILVSAPPPPPKKGYRQL